MIIFYDKQTGDIVGTIDGRVHSQEHLKMWIGDKATTDRMIIEFEPVNERVEIIEEPRYAEAIDEEGFAEVMEIGKVKRKVKICDFEPNCKSKTQKDIFMDIDRRRKRISEFKVNPKTKNLIQNKGAVKKREIKTGRDGSATMIV